MCEGEGNGEAFILEKFVKKMLTGTDRSTVNIFDFGWDFTGVHREERVCGLSNPTGGFMFALRLGG
jgi:hypothetical protein